MQVNSNPPPATTGHPDILLIEDDDSFAQELAEYLGAHGLTCTRLPTLDELDAQIRTIEPRVVVLDQFVGGKDVLTLLPSLRSYFTGGLVVLTANRDDTDRVVGLELGADDFIVKTQQPREVLARVRAVMRRSYGHTGGLQPDVSGAMHEVTPSAPSAWVIDPLRREIYAPDGQRVPLTATEFELLAYLNARTGQTVLRHDLYMAILRRPAYSSDDRAIDNLVSRARAALTPYLGDHNPIRAMRGVGYIYVGLDPAHPPAE